MTYRIARWERRSGRDRRDPPEPGRRRVWPGVEALEARWLPSLAYQFTDAVGAVGNGPVDVEANAVANDAAGNVYVTGSLRGSADFDPGPGVSNLASRGGRDVFLAKYTRTGALVWASDLGGADGTSVGQGAAVAVDGSGSVVVAGTFTGSLNFTPSPGVGTFVQAPGRNDVFVARYDPNGSLVWARDVTGTAGNVDEAYALAVDGSGKIAVGGSFQGAATFGNVTLTAGGAFDAFVTELDASGRFLWAGATAGVGSSVAQASGVTFDGSGNVVATGFFAGKVDFDPGAGVVTLPYSGSRDVFVQKFDFNGNLVWARGVGGTDVDQGNAVAADGAGSVYVTGTFSTSVNFNPGAGSAATKVAGGLMDGFVWKLDAGGRFGWVNGLSTTGYNSAQGTGVALDGAGHVFVAGYYSGALKLDPTLTGATFTSAGGSDVFLGEYDGSGSFLAGQSAGGAGFDASFGVGVNGAGLVATAGRFTGPATFGPTTLAAQPNNSLFLAQLVSTTPAAPTSPAAPALEPGSDTGQSQSDRLTNATTLVLDVSGLSAPGNRVDLLRDGLVVASRVGPGPLTDPGPLADGVYVYTARQTDVSNQASAPSPGTTVTVQTKTPATPGPPGLLPDDDSGVKGDGLTNVRRPRITGTADPLALVQLLDAFGSVVSGTTAAADGSYTFTTPSPLADGPVSFRVREMDMAGNVSPPGAPVALVIDTAAPATPSALALLPTDDSGAPGDGITSVKQPRLTGNAPAGTTVQLVNAAGVVVGATTAGQGGTFTVSSASPLADGTYALHAQAVDAAANVSAAGVAITLTVLTTPPAAPAAPSLLPADDSGLAGDNLTNVRRPRLTGTAAGAASVQIIGPAGTVLGSSAVGVGGAYTVSFAAPLADGALSIKVQATDLAGNTSDPGPSLTLTIDGTAPAAPAPPSLATADDSGAAGDGITNVKQPRFVGSTEGGAAVQLLNAAGAVVGAAKAAADGGFVISPSAPLADGAYALRVQAVDAAGNVGAASSSASLTVDTTAPAAPGAPALLPADDSWWKGDGVTNVRQPRLSGTAEPGSTVQLVSVPGGLIGTAVAGTGGLFTVATTVPLVDGVYDVSAVARDAAGNTGPAGVSWTLTVLTSTPDAPQGLNLLAADDTGVKGDGATNLRQPHLVGTAPPGATVQLSNALGVYLAWAAAGPDGRFTVQPQSPLPVGTTVLQARAVDAAGNPSTFGTSYTLTVTASTPTAPAAPALLPADDTGVVGDGRTAVRRPHLTGKVAPGASVDLLDPNGLVLGTSVASAVDGSYRVQPSANLPTAVNDLSIRVRVGGDESPPGPAFRLTVVGATAGDYDGDGKTDLATFRPSTGVWNIQGSAGGSQSTQFGAFDLVHIPAPGDYDGLGRTELALFRPSSAQWYIAAPGGLRTVQFGDSSQGDVPVPGDYDGVGHAEFAVFRPGSDRWLILGPGGLRVVQFGDAARNDIPVPGDYDGTGRTEMAVFRPATAQWFIASPGGLRVVQFGAVNLVDIPVPGDYDGVGHAEFAVFRPSTGQWLILGPSGLKVIAFGGRNLTDLPAQAPVDSLIRLGLVGGVRTAALTVGGTVHAEALTSVVSTAPAASAPAPAAPTARPRVRPAQVTVLGTSLDGLSSARRYSRTRDLSTGS